MPAPSAALSAPRAVLTLVALLAAVLTGCGDDDRAAPAPDGRAAQRPAMSVPEIYRQLEPSVVGIAVRGARGQGEGSGVVIRPDTIVTNAHVVAGAEEIEVATAAGDRRPAELLAADTRTDLALLRVPGGRLPPAELASDELPEVGSLAVAIGNPLGFENSVTAGVVSGLDRAVPSGGRTPALVGLLQTDAAISPGNSGGALAGPDGRLIGINVAYIPPQAAAVSIGFAIPAPTVEDIVSQLLEDGEVVHPYLGVQLRPLTPQIAERLEVDTARGAVVAGVEPGAPAAAAGIRGGDILVRVGPRPIESVEDVLTALRSAAPGDRLPVVVMRDGERRTLQVTVGRQPQRPFPGPG